MSLQLFFQLDENNISIDQSEDSVLGVWGGDRGYGGASLGLFEFEYYIKGFFGDYCHGT